MAVHDNVQLFLTGTIIPSPLFCRHPNNQYATRSKQTKVSPLSSSPLVMVKEKLGILKSVVEYVGYPTPQELDICCQLICLLSAFIDDALFVKEEEEDE